MRKSDFHFLKPIFIVLSHLPTKCKNLDFSHLEEYQNFHLYKSLISDLFHLDELTSKPQRNWTCHPDLAPFGDDLRKMMVVIPHLIFVLA